MSNEAVFLSSSISVLNSVGPKREAALRGIGIASVEDLLNYIPNKHLDRRAFSPISALMENEQFIIKGVVAEIKDAGRRFFSVILEDDSGAITGTWFTGVKYIKDVFSLGDRVVLAGKVSSFKEELQMTHPEYHILKEGDEGEEFLGYYPVYTITEEMHARKIENKLFMKLVKGALERFVEPEVENVPKILSEKRFYPSIKKVYISLHFPQKEYELSLRNRLKYEEVFLFMYRLHHYKLENLEEGIAFNECNAALEICLKGLHFDLTAAQNRVLKELKDDMHSSRRMYRLIQGDVGSGKTVLAALAALISKNSHKQSVLMVPTEILAKQHYKTFHDLFEHMGFHTVFISGSQKKSERIITEDEIANGTADVIIGTHAAISTSLEYKSLGLVIIDEQHRFGVNQRIKLIAKGEKPDILVMSATPIPRTLSHILYGDLDISVIDELPPGRKPVKTFNISEAKREDMFNFIKEKIESDNQAFFLYPLISPSEKSALKSLEEGFIEIEKTFHGIPVGYVHGKMKPEQRDDILKRFRSGEYKILITTTVIEVGIDIPGANIMVIEESERFGLSQLHQLRGRIGRGGKESFCFLMHGEDLSEIAVERLKIFASTNDGFKIAEQDYGLRGPGEIAGIRQSGLPEFKFINIVKEGEFVGEVKEDVIDIFEGKIEITRVEREHLESYLKSMESEDLRMLGG